jgi:hypothetical protein
LVADFNSNATVAAVQAVIRNITFRNLSDSPSALARTVRMVVSDGDGGTSSTVTKTVNVSSTNDLPLITSGTTGNQYSLGGEAIGLDTSISINDPDLLDFAAGVLTVAISTNPLSGDVLAVRNIGNGAGQVGVAGNTVSFGGVAVGVWSGGTTGTPLAITFNAGADQAAVQAVARTVTFQTTNTRISPLPRTISYSLTDGDGGTSNTASLVLKQSFVRKYGFQEGVDSGLGPYTGAADTQLQESLPTTPRPTGQNIEGILIDFDGGTANAQGLIRFNNIFGSGQGQIPAGSMILSARLVFDTNNPGDGATAHRMLTSWDAETATWNTFESTVYCRVGSRSTGYKRERNLNRKSEHHSVLEMPQLLRRCLVLPQMYKRGQTANPIMDGFYVAGIPEPTAGQLVPRRQRTLQTVLG